MTSDAKHYVAPSLPTVIDCMREALRSAEVLPGDIDAVNAHAASTNVGDATEHKALTAVFGEGFAQPVCANKSQIGHTMGASSAIEAILAVEGMSRDTLLPTINYQVDEKIPLDAVSGGARNLRHKRVLSNSFGFGGCNVCLVLVHEES